MYSGGLNLRPDARTERAKRHAGGGSARAKGRSALDGPIRQDVLISITVGMALRTASPTGEWRSAHSTISRSWSAEAALDVISTWTRID